MCGFIPTAGSNPAPSASDPVNTRLSGAFCFRNLLADLLLQAPGRLVSEVAGMRSVDGAKVSWCGSCKPNARQMRDTAVRRVKPDSRAMVRLLQCAAPSGTHCRVLAVTVCTRASLPRPVNTVQEKVLRLQMVLRTSNSRHQPTTR